MSSNIDGTILARHLPAIQNASILVIGDLILDRFIYGSGLKLSQEAPVPVILVDNQKYSLGGAANVAANLRALGCKNVDICGLIGKDHDGSKINHMLHEAGIHEFCVYPEKFLTTCKTRVIANDQHIVRYDIEEKTARQWHDYIGIIDTIRGIKLAKYDAVIVSDYNKGVVGPAVVDLIKEQFSGCYLFADPKPSNFNLFKDFYCITPNLKEAVDFVHLNDLNNIACTIRSKLNLTNIVITMSEKGVFILDKDNNSCEYSVHAPHIAVERHHRIDVTGAGDTLIATLAASIASGMDIFNSLFLANIAAGIVVNKLGTSICSYQELMTEICIMNGVKNDTT